MASFARDHSEGPGVRSALLDEYGHATERRRPADSKSPRSGTDVEGSSSGEEPVDEHENNNASNDESPPDNSP